MRMKAVVAIVVGVALGLAGCSSSGNVDNSGASSKADFCVLVIAFKTANDALGNQVIDDTPAQVQAALQQIIGQVETLRKRAPADVKVDVETIAQYISQFDTLLAKHNYDLKAVSGNDEVAKEFQSLNSDELNAARDRLGNYPTAECADVTTTSSQGS